MADDDLEGGEVVEEDLPAAAARRDDPAVAVAHGDDRVQVVDALGGRRADEDQFGAGASGEVVGVHRGDDPAVPGAGRGRHGVVVPRQRVRATCAAAWMSSWSTGPLASTGPPGPTASPGPAGSLCAVIVPASVRALPDSPGRQCTLRRISRRR